MAILKFKTRKNIYSSKQLARYVLTDQGRIEHPFAEPILMQNIHHFQLETIHRSFLENYKQYAKKRKGGNALLHEIIAISKKDTEITPEMLKEMMQKYAELRGLHNAVYIMKSHNNQHIHVMILNNEYKSFKTLRMSHIKMKTLLREFELWHRQRFPHLLKNSIVHTTPERMKAIGNKRDIAQENRNTRREKEYSLKQRIGNKPTQKEQVSELVNELLDKANSFTDLVAFIRETKELDIYTYRGKLRGVMYHSRKFTFRNLQISKERLMILERHQQRLDELKLIKEMHQKTRERLQGLERG